MSCYIHFYVKCYQYQIIVGRPIVCQTFAKTIDLFEWRNKTNYITFALSHSFDSCNGFLAAKNEKDRYSKSV